MENIVNTKCSWCLPKPIARNPLSQSSLPIEIRALLVRKGIDTEELVDKYLNPPPPPDPIDEFPELDNALKRLINACRYQEKIAICGDYDADGMTSTALLSLVLSDLNASPVTYIPNRTEDGYGLNTNMIELINREGINLIITVDNGVAATDALQLAKDYNIDVIVTDHHSYTKKPKNIHSLIHPLTTKDHSPYRHLAGVGIAYILASSLANKLNNTNKVLDAMHLLCIGTIADMTPLLGANRVLIKEGLSSIKDTNIKGIKALLKLTGLESKKLTSDDIGFQVAPRINAVGRIGEPKLIIDLLLEEDSEKAMKLALECDELNRRRKFLCEGVEAEATALIESDGSYCSDFILIAQNHWHHGVIGIVAARLVEKYNKPTAILSSEKNGFFRASVRSPNGFSVIKALESCSNLLQRYGGHEGAGGFTIEAKNIKQLDINLNNFTRDWYSRHPKLLQVKPDIHLSFKHINWKLYEYIQSFEPFGIGNLKPIFWSRKCKVVGVREINKRHMSLVLSRDNTKLKAIHWNNIYHVNIGSDYDVAYTIKSNTWNNLEEIQLELKGIKMYSNEIVLRKKDRNYIVRYDGGNILTLSNSSGKKIVVKLSRNMELEFIDSTLDNNYVREIFEDSLIALGLLP